MADCDYPYPCGFRFRPTEDELFYYLERKMNGEQLPPYTFTDCDLYGDKNPWDLFNQNSSEYFYVFTKLKKKKDSNARIMRTAGYGNWMSLSKKVFRNIDKGLRVKKDFVFEINKKRGNVSSNSHGRWLMQEFSLGDEGVNSYVLCKICNKYAKDKEKQEENGKSRALNVIPHLENPKKRSVAGDDAEDQNPKRIRITCNSNTEIDSGENLEDSRAVLFPDEYVVSGSPEEPSSTLLAPSYIMPTPPFPHSNLNSQQALEPDIAASLETANSSIWDPSDIIRGLPQDLYITSLFSDIDSEIGAALEDEVDILSANLLAPMEDNNTYSSMLHLSLPAQEIVSEPYIAASLETANSDIWASSDIIPDLTQDICITSLFSDIDSESKAALEDKVNTLYANLLVPMKDNNSNNSVLHLSQPSQEIDSTISAPAIMICTHSFSPLNLITEEVYGSVPSNMTQEQALYASLEPLLSSDVNFRNQISSDIFCNYF